MGGLGLRLVVGQAQARKLDGLTGGESRISPRSVTAAIRSSKRRVSQGGAAAGAAGRSCAEAGAAAKPPAIAAATSPRLIPPALERF